MPSQHWKVDVELNVKKMPNWTLYQQLKSQKLKVELNIDFTANFNPDLTIILVIWVTLVSL